MVTRDGDPVVWSGELGRAMRWDGGWKEFSPLEWNNLACGARLVRPSAFVNPSRLPTGEGAHPDLSEAGQALMCGNVWYATRVRRDSLELVVRSAEAEWAPILALGDPARDDVQLHAGPGGSLLVSRLFGPFSAKAVSASGETLLEFDAPPWVGDSTLVGMPLMPVPPGYLHIAADLTGDRRLLTTYDSAGRVLRTVQIHGLMGLSFADSASGLLLGVQADGFQRLIGYRWRWESDESVNH